MKNAQLFSVPNKKNQKKTKKKSELVLSQIIIRDATLGLLTYN